MKLRSGRAEGKAVIAGLSCRLPCSRNVEEFWKNLIEGKDMIGETRWPEGLLNTPPRAGLIEDIDKFDADFFKFTDEEANSLNPLLRHLLEVTYECIADSGIPLSVLHNSTTGAYTACFIPDNDNIETSRCSNSKYCSTVSMITGHVMNHFKLTGPSATVDTACSSSITALEMAVSDLVAGRCQFALVTACNLLFNPSYLQQMSYLGMLSSVGQSRVFDADAKGYVRAEGVVAILLTRQATICQHIYTSVIDVKTNCNGYNTEGITFPSKDGQCSLMRDVYRRSGINTEDISYMELHSTGTPVGDPIEVRSVAEAICSTRSEPLLIGSVKANMGHSEATAGLASLVKCILSARYGIIPPQINFKNPNPNIEAIKEGHVVVVDSLTDLKDGYIGLNSFGFGGSNGHVILKPFKKKSKATEKKFSLIPICARNIQEKEAVLEFVESNKDNATLMAHLSCSLLSYDVRRQIRGYAVIDPSQTELITHFSNKESTCPPEFWLCLQDFVWDMIEVDPQLLNTGCFMKSIMESQAIVKNRLGLKMVMTEALKFSSKPITSNGLIKAIAVLIGLVDCLKAAKVDIKGVIGIGLSEIVACYVDGCLTREQCINVAYIIGQVLEEHSKHAALDYQIFKVKLKLEDLYCLGAKVKVLTTLSESMGIIAVSKDYVQQTMKLIHEKGGYFQHLSDGIIMYSKLLEGLRSKIQEKLQVVIPYPKLRSGLMKHVDNQVDSTGVGNLLTSCVKAHDIVVPPGVTVINVSLTCIQTNMADSITCKPSPVSLLQTIGEVHIRGHPVDVSVLHQPDYPLDVKSPSISSLIRWQHSKSWLIPQWTDFFSRVKDEAVKPYTIDMGESEGIHTPMATLLYHSWLAIAQKYSMEGCVLDKCITFANLDLNSSADMVNKLQQGAVIQVLKGTQRFAVHNQGILLLSGNYKLDSKRLSFPKIPGYDVDINENIEDDGTSDLLQKTEILWEDDWLEFINTVIEFNMEYFESGIVKVMIDPMAIREEVKDCANVLAVAEKYTGLCKAGSFMIQNLVTSHLVQIGRKSNIAEYSSTLVNQILAYNLQSNGTDSDKILVYQGQNTTTRKPVLGIILMAEKEIICREIPVEEDRLWQTEDIQQIVPYIVAVYLLSDCSNTSLLLCPPIDTVGMYIMALASEDSGISIFTSSYDVETRQMIEKSFPFVCVLPGDNLVQSVKSATQGEGCDVCIKFTSGELNSCLDVVGANGRFLQCAKPLETIEIAKLQLNKTLKLVDVKDAFISFLKQSDEEIKTLMFEMRDGKATKLRDEGYPEVKGLLYSLDEQSNFVDPLPISQILNILEEPGVNLSDSFKCMMESDILAMERLHSVITTKPKDFSLWVKSESQTEEDPLNEGRISPPSSLEQTELKIDQCGSNTVIIKIPNVVLPSPDQDFPPTSTPMVRFGKPTKAADLHESYIDTAQSETLQQLPPQPLVITPVPCTKPKKTRPIDLLFVNSPGPHAVAGFSPMTPAIKTLLTPTIKEPSLVPLNMLPRNKPPMFIVHPITGKVTLLKTLGGLLSRQCYGIQRTASTPRDSLAGVASYYINALQLEQTDGPYIIAGYSFGSIVAIEMALQLQSARKKVDRLILLDGGPEYFTSQFKAAQKPSKDQQEMDLYLEIGALINFLMMFVPVPNIRLVQSILYQLPNQEARIQTVVEMSFNKVEFSSSPLKTKWLMAKEKVLEKVKDSQKTGKNKMANAVQEVLVWKRREQAKDFIRSVDMVYRYKNTHDKFKGDIYLLRIKSDPPLCDYMPVDYGLQDWCSGKVHITFYNGSHETFLNRDSGVEVAEHINQIMS